MVPTVNNADIGFRVASPFSTGAVPAVSTWGVVIILLFIVAVGGFVFKRVNQEVESY